MWQQSLEFKKIESDDRTKCITFYSILKPEIIINESDTDDVFASIHSTIISNIHKSLGKGLDWIIDLVISHTKNNSKYNRVSGSSYIKRI